MFKKLVEGEREQIAFRFDGRALSADGGTTIAVALLQAGEIHLRTTSSGARRGPYCLMGACYECLVVVDGVNRQACQIVLESGMNITRVESLSDSTPDRSADE